MDETKWKIMRAAIELIRDNGYTATTTKDIAQHAGVNECTIFRKFKNKKEIVLCALDETDWMPNLNANSFAPCVWDLQTDLEMFASTYLKNVTSESVKLSIGLRAPQIYNDTTERIMKIPAALKQVVQEYFEHMYQKNKIRKTDFECLATMFLSLYFGFVFFKASFGNSLTKMQTQEYIKNSIAIFIEGIQQKS